MIAWQPEISDMRSVERRFREKSIEIEVNEKSSSANTGNELNRIVK